VWVGNFEGDSMHDVSGVTGAAPVWRELMSELHRAVESTPPAAPPGVVSAMTTFAPAIEPPRREWFFARQVQERTVTVTRAAEFARIASPANGMVIALDPDIPVSHQKLPISVQGRTSALLLKLDRELLPLSGATTLWTPQAGAHRLDLEDASGKVLDSILFTVR
jgi:penicillin-binding protein 1C